MVRRGVFEVVVERNVLVRVRYVLGAMSVCVCAVQQLDVADNPSLVITYQQLTIPAWPDASVTHYG